MCVTGQSGSIISNLSPYPHEILQKTSLVVSWLILGSFSVVLELTHRDVSKNFGEMVEVT